MYSIIKNLKKGDYFIFNDKIYRVKQKFSDWKKNNSPYLLTTCGEIFYNDDLEVEFHFKQYQKK
jgi:hypothetical protein